MHEILVMQILRGSIRSHKFVSHYVSPTPYPLQATCMCKCALQMFIQSSRFHTSMFFNISNRGAGDDFALLFLIYVLLTNSQRNKPSGYHDAVSKCSCSTWDTTSKMAERAYGNARQTKTHKYKFCCEAIFFNFTLISHAYNCSFTVCISYTEYTMSTTKLYQKISWVCCCLYCYKFSAPVAIPTATNKWCFSSIA